MSEPAASLSPAAPPATLRTHVAVVDDDPAFLRAVRRSVVRHRDRIRVMLFGGSAELRARVDRERFELIVQVLRGAVLGDVADAAARTGARHIVARPCELAALFASLVCTTQLPRGTPMLDRIADALAATRALAIQLAVRVRPLLAEDHVESIAFLALCAAAAQFDPSSPESFRWVVERRVRRLVADELGRVGADTRGRRLAARDAAVAAWDLLAAGHEPTAAAIERRIDRQIDRRIDRQIERRIGW